MNKAAGHGLYSSLGKKILRSDLPNMETMICECDRPSEHIGTHHDQVQTADDEVYKAPKVSTFFIIQGIQITENAYQAEKQYHKENMELIDKIHEMAVMRHAADVDDYNITEITKNYPDWKQKMTF
ncbi:uncharacterized protein LOC120344637 isoform X2 [Styela clava]